MSTKIYTAWRIPKSRLNEFVGIVRVPVLKGFLKMVRNLMAGVKPEVFEKKIAHYRETWKDNPEEFEKRKKHIERSCRWDAVEGLLHEYDDMSERSGLESYSGLNIWIHGPHAYVIPHGAVLQFFRVAKFTVKQFPSWAKDYCYWDNTDQPEGMTRGEWKRRGQMWDKVCLDNWNDVRLYHEITNMKTGEATPTTIFVQRHLFPERFREPRRRKSTK